MTTTKLRFQDSAFFSVGRWTEDNVAAVRAAVAALTTDKMPEAGCEGFYQKLDEHLHKEVRRLAAIPPEERAKMPHGMAGLFHDLESLLDNRKELCKAHSRLDAVSQEVESRREGLKGQTTDSARMAASIAEIESRAKALWGAQS